MNLYKYIGFHKDHWSEPLLKELLHFSSVSQLHTVNDETEFVHLWDTTSHVLNTYGYNFREAYERLFNNTRLLSLSKHLTEKCWHEFCPQGGVSYVFEFSEYHYNEEVTCRHVNYVDEKTLNVPTYLFRNLKSSRTKYLLFKTDALTKEEGRELLDNLSNELPKIFNDHIIEEVVKKKIRNRFAFENEFRFIHLENVTPQNNFNTRLINSKLKFQDLRLTLIAIYTSNPEKVTDIFDNANVPIKVPKFLQG